MVSIWSPISKTVVGTNFSTSQHERPYVNVRQRQDIEKSVGEWTKSLGLAERTGDANISAHTFHPVSGHVTEKQTYVNLCKTFQVQNTTVTFYSPTQTGLYFILNIPVSHAKI